MSRSSVALAAAIPLCMLAAAAATHLATAQTRANERMTPHLSFVVSVVPDVVAAATRLSVNVDIRPRHGIHVYAPGTQYRPVRVVLDADPLLQIENAIYPQPHAYLFKPLNEQVLVYDEPFRVAQLVTIGGPARPASGRRARSSLTIRGRLEYQACDAEVCYLPASIGFEQSVRMK